MMLVEAIMEITGAAYVVKDEEGKITAFDKLEKPILYDMEKAIVKAEELKIALDAKQYAQKRKREYPDFADYLDGIVKGDKAQIDAYIAACQAVKNKYPKPE